MQEIEVKVSIRNKSHVMEKLSLLGCKFSSPIMQHDFIFLDSSTKFGQFKPGTIVSRIRKQDDIIQFNVKKHLSNELDCLEEEVIISSKEIMENILSLYGQKLVVEVKKQRILTKFKDFNICIDSVENLGDYLEVEVLTEGSDGELIQEKIVAWLASIGISEDLRIMVGYDTLMVQKNGVNK